MRDELLREIKHMDDAIAWAQGGLKDAPEGRLLIDVNRGAARYFWRKNPTDKKGSYLNKRNKNLVKALAQKEYEAQLLKAAQNEKGRLEKMLALCDGDQKNPLVCVYDDLPDNRKTLVEPYELSDEEYAQQWMQHEYEHNGHSFGVGGLFTKRGQQVRSKSEVIIANMLDDAGVPYRYEQALFIGGYSPVYPDFTVLNKRTRAEFVWEHLGGMDDPEYCQQALRKLNDYAQAGYLPGEKLLVTQESAAVPLDTRVVGAIIERFLL